MEEEEAAALLPQAVEGLLKPEVVVEEPLLSLLRLSLASFRLLHRPHICRLFFLCPN